MTDASKTTVVVAIPAYNEQNNIGRIIEDVLRQKANAYQLARILVYSDGSIDETNGVVKGFADSRVQLIEGEGKQGLANGQNRLLESANEDVLVLLNADVRIMENDVLEKLVRPVASGQADLVSSRLEPLPPTTFFEKVLQFSVELKDKLISKFNGGNNYLTCHGPNRAFSRRLYKQLRFQSSTGEDTYSYLVCMQKGLPYAYVSDARVYYRLPNNYLDHKNQSMRYFSNESFFMRDFDEGFLKKHLGIPRSAVLAGAVSALPLMLRHPILTVCYLAVVASIRLGSLLRTSKVEDNWEVSHSSKNVGGGK